MLDRGEAISTAETAGMPSEDTFIVKVFLGVHGGDLVARCFKLRHLYDELGVVSLEILGTLFEEATGSPLSCPLYYTDRDGVVAAVSTTRELHDAISQCLEKSQLQLFAGVQDNQTVEKLLKQTLVYEPSAAVRLCTLLNTEKQDIDVVKHLVDDLEEHVRSLFVPMCKFCSGRFKLWEYNIDEKRVTSKYFAVDGCLLVRNTSQCSLLLPNAVYAQLTKCIGGMGHVKWSDAYKAQEIPLEIANEIPVFLGKRVGTPTSAKFFSMEDLLFGDFLNEKKRSPQKHVCITGIFTAEVGSHRRLIPSAFLSIIAEDLGVKLN